MTVDDEEKLKFSLEEKFMNWKVNEYMGTYKYNKERSRLRSISVLEI
jgi:hypothetical protein